MGVELALSVPNVLFPEFAVTVGGLAAGTSRAGESKVKDPEAPRRGLVCILPRGFDISMYRFEKHTRIDVQG